jgi:predicted PhzF superfamily epimerase YddE/YHI9
VRFFGPWAGIAEDPVTGSAFTVAAPYVSGALLGGRQRLKARQCSGRGGDVWVDLGAQPGRVVVAGEAVMAATRTLPLV